MLAKLVLLGALSGALIGCGATPEATEPPPTQTPWIIVITATPEPEGVAQVQPTQTPWIIVATPTRVETRATQHAAVGPSATAGPAVISVSPTSKPSEAKPPAPDTTPGSSSLKYPSPALLEPAEGSHIPWKGTVLLTWSSVGTLAESEYYHLHLERPPKREAEEWYGDYVFTKETEFLLQGSFLAPFHLPAEQGEGVVYWWVRVVRGTGEDANGKPIGSDVGEHSERRTLILEPKPRDS